MESRYPEGYVDAARRFLAAADERDPMPTTPSPTVRRIDVSKHVTSGRRQAALFVVVMVAAVAPLVATAMSLLT